MIATIAKKSSHNARLMTMIHRQHSIIGIDPVTDTAYPALSDPHRSIVFRSDTICSELSAHRLQLLDGHVFQESISRPGGASGCVSTHIASTHPIAARRTLTLNVDCEWYAARHGSSYPSNGFRRMTKSSLLAPTYPSRATDQIRRRLPSLPRTAGGYAGPAQCSRGARELPGAADRPSGFHPPRRPRE